MDHKVHVRRSAAKHYEDGSRIWDPSDKWNETKRLHIEEFCAPIVSRIEVSADQTLNAGAGSHRYTWLPMDAFACDRFEKQLRGYENGVCCELENLAFEDARFELVVCVGSVLNYTSAFEAISEMSRVLKVGGHLLLHFECSDSLEHIGTRKWKKDVEVTHTMNNGSRDTVWIYSRDFVRRSLERSSFSIVKESSFHILSSLMLRLGLSQDRSARFSRFDGHLRFLAKFSDDVVFHAVKEQPTPLGFANE